MTHSSAHSTPRSYPKTDLEALRTWASFPSEIHNAIQAATASAHLSSTSFHINTITRQKYVETEENIRVFADMVLHDPVVEVLHKLQVNGRFVTPGSRNVAIIGSPDFSWVVSAEQPYPKLVVEYKTWWAADLEQDAHGNMLNQDSLHALEQIYGYMTFNNNRFGILTNWRCVLFLRRAEGHTLDFYRIRLDGNQDISMLKAWVGMVLLADRDWFYASPTLSSPPPNQTFGTSQTARTDQKRAIAIAQEYCIRPVAGNYECCPLDFRLCHFDISTARHGQNGCVVDARLEQRQQFPILLNHKLQVVCKIIDISHYPNSLNDEVRAYAALKHLQGKVIPTFHGFYIVWGILQVIALEPVGKAITKDEQIDQQLRKKMREALQQIHKAGYVHGDVARRNFCRSRNGHIFLVDLERCRLATNQNERLNEMNVVDGL